MWSQPQNIMENYSLWFLVNTHKKWAIPINTHDRELRQHFKPWRTRELYLKRGQKYTQEACEEILLQDV